MWVVQAPACFCMRYSQTQSGRKGQFGADEVGTEMDIFLTLGSFAKLGQTDENYH